MAKSVIAANTWSDAARKAAAIARRSKFWSKAGSLKLIEREAKIPVKVAEETPGLIKMLYGDRSMWGFYNPRNAKLKTGASIGVGKTLPRGTALHEVGHHKLGHGTLGDISSEELAKKEAEAWRWAVKNHKKLGVSKKEVFQALRTSEQAGEGRGSLFPVRNMRTAAIKAMIHNSNPEGYNQYKKSGGFLKTAGKVGLIAGGALAGGALGARTLPRILGKGRLMTAGENLTGKIVATSKGLFKPSSLIPVKGTTLDRVLRHTTRKPGVKGKLAKAAEKVDEFFSIPQSHYGVGVSKHKIADYSNQGVQEQSRRDFGKFWNRTWEEPANEVRVVAEGAVKGTKGESRKAAEAALKKRYARAGKWKGDDMCLGDKDCEVFARTVGQGKKVNKTIQRVKAGAIGGAAIGATPGATTLIPRKENQEIRNMLQVINGGPGSGFHGHKGIPGHRGGSVSEGKSAPSVATSQSTLIRSLFRAPVSDSPQASARRDKTAFTRAARLAEIFGSHAESLEKKRKAKWMPLSKEELTRLAEAHAAAAGNFRASAEQATLLRSSTKEEQQARLEKAAHHQAQADKYAARVSPKSGAVSTLGKAFAYGLIGGTPEEAAARAAYKLGQAGSDIAGTAIKAGSIQLRRESFGKDKTISEILSSVGEKMGNVSAIRARELAKEAVERPSRFRQEYRDLEVAKRIAASMRLKAERDNALRRELSPTTRKSGKRGSSGGQSAPKFTPVDAAVIKALYKSSKGFELSPELKAKYGIA